MVNIKGLMREVKYECFKNILLDIFLRSIILFFIADMIRSLIDFSYVASFGVTALYFLIKLLREMKKITVHNFQKDNKEAHEMLSTAADNLNINNIVVQGLFEDVMKKAKQMSSGSLVVPKTIMMMILLIPVLAIADFEMSPLRLDVIAESELIQNINFDFVKGYFNQTRANDADIIDDALLEADIYGDKNIAKLGNKDINIKMNLGFETDLTRPKDEDTSQIAFRDYPEDENVELLDDSNSHMEHIEESDLARRYNEKIRNMG